MKYKKWLPRVMRQPFFYIDQSLHSLSLNSSFLQSKKKEIGSFIAADMAK